MYPYGNYQVPQTQFEYYPYIHMVLTDNYRKYRNYFNSRNGSGLNAELIC
ncbi:hypothetical protein M3226_24430 [Neobacillus cucumis]|nr:hypothetical protein [Neobacillus cucumis]MCM3728795.1 hypothetical protein [Neobacillus cucumis]